MAAHTTRMLLLGAVAMFEPVNGYQIRRELGSWRVDEWANLGPGSIYSGLTTLERLGQVVRHDLDDDGRRVAVYEITDPGRAALDRLLGEGLEAVTPFSSVAFHAAFGLLPLLRREVASAHLRARLVRLERALAEEVGEGVPPHAAWGLRLARRQGEVERAWLAETLERLGAGELDLAGEEWTWTPPADDAGHQMEADRRKYRALLGR